MKRSLTEWIGRGAGGHYVVKRLKRPLARGDVAKIRHAAEAFEGHPYDLYFE